MSSFTSTIHVALETSAFDVLKLQQKQTFGVNPFGVSDLLKPILPDPTIIQWSESPSSMRPFIDQ
jgi:hypothetical protein